MQNLSMKGAQEISWSEINRAECDAESLRDMCSWAEAD